MANTKIHMVLRKAPAGPPPVVKINTNALGGEGTVLLARLCSTAIYRKAPGAAKRLLMVTDEDSVLSLDPEGGSGILYKGASGWFLTDIEPITDLTLTTSAPSDEEEAAF